MSPLILKTHIIEGQQPGPHLLITGGVHGDEWEPMVAIRRLIDLPELADICRSHATQSTSDAECLALPNRQTSNPPLDVLAEWNLQLEHLDGKPVLRQSPE